LVMIEKVSNKSAYFWLILLFIVNIILWN
jgi:hypothetical protein